MRNKALIFARTCGGRLFLALVVLLCHVLLNVPAQAADYDLDNRVKAELIERFTRFVDWPDLIHQTINTPVSEPPAGETNLLGKTSEYFDIVFWGTHSVSTVLSETLRDVSVKGRPVRVREISNISELSLQSLPHVVFVSPAKRKQVLQLLRHLGESPVLTIGDSPGLAEEGVQLNFYREQGYIRFEVNYSSVVNSQLDVSSKLLKLGKPVEDKRR